MEALSLQTAFNILLTFLGILGGWWLKALSSAHHDLRSADKELSEKVQNIELLVAGQYVHQNSFKEMTNNIFSTLRRIEDKLDNKMDKTRPE